MNWFMEQLSKTVTKRRWEQDMIDDQQRIRTVCDCGFCTGDVEIDAEEVVRELEEKEDDPDESDDDPPEPSVGFICAGCARTWPSKHATEVNGDEFCPECVDE